MRFNLIGLLIGLVFISCKNETYKNKYTLRENNYGINIQIGSSSTNTSNCIQYMSSGDTDYLAVMTKRSKSVEIYNLNDKYLFKTINIKNEGPDAFPNLTGFIMINMDSLIAIGQNRQIGIIDKYDKVLKKFSYAKDIYGRNVLPVFADLGSKPYIVGDSLFLVAGFNSYGTSGILTSISQRKNPVNLSVNIKTAKSKLSFLKIPEELIGKDITGIHAWRTIGYQNTFIYSYSLIDDLFITNDHLSFNKVTLETNYKLKLKENLSKGSTFDFNKAMQYYFSRDEIIAIHFDKYRECYYIVVNKRIEDFINVKDYRLLGMYPKFFIIILDKNLKFLGDVYFPDDTYNCKMMFITSKGLFISEDNINNPTFNEDYMRFKLFTLEKI